jgi:hypothetical protein
MDRRRVALLVAVAAAGPTSKGGLVERLAREDAADHDAILQHVVVVIAPLT